MYIYIFIVEENNFFYEYDFKENMKLIIICKIDDFRRMDLIL